MTFGRIVSIAVVIAGIAGTATAQSLPGDWDWGVGGGHTVIAADGTGEDGRGNTMKWTLVDPAARRYRLVWSHGFTDDAVLSADGASLTIVNDVGTRFVSTRRVAAPAVAPAAGGPGPAVAGSISPWTVRPPSSSPLPLQVLAGIGFSPGSYVVFVGDTDATGRTVTAWVSRGPYELRAGETWRADVREPPVFERDPTPSAAGPDRASIVALNGDPQRRRAICVLPAGVPVSTCGAGSGNVGTAPGAGGATAPGGGGPVPPTSTGAGGLPAGHDGFDSTSIRRGDPFDGGEWANAQGGRAYAVRELMPPVCISGFTLESAGSDVTTRGAKIEITLHDPYGGTYRALDLSGAAIARDFSPGGSGTVVSARSADFPPFRTSRVEVTMTGHGWFLMKGLRFRVVACP